LAFPLLAFGVVAVLGWSPLSLLQPNTDATRSKRALKVLCHDEFVSNGGFSSSGSMGQFKDYYYPLTHEAIL
jgi:hypothetical protein